MSKNENCLAGKRCPRCGNEDAFNIVAIAIVCLTDGGTDFPSSIEWDEDAQAECCNCGYSTAWCFFDTSDNTPSTPA